MVTDERISGDFEYVYDADANVFHYAPFDYNGNRTYTGETLDASTVEGFDPSSAGTGTTKSVLFDPATGKASIEHSGTTPDTTDDSLVSSNVVLTAANILDSLDDSNANMGPFQTQAEADAAAAANAAATGDTFNDATDNNNTGETLTVGDGNGDKTGGGVSVVKTDGSTSTDTVTGDGTSTVSGGNGESVSDVFNGADGNDGIDGADGLNGNDGADGTNGKDGKNGRNGVSLGSAPLAGGMLSNNIEFDDILKPELLHLAKLIYS